MPAVQHDDVAVWPASGTRSTQPVCIEAPRLTPRKCLDGVGMSIQHGRVHAVLIALILLLLPGVPVAAQSISGVVTDTSGAVLPGVTIEASSAAQNQAARTVQTDESGRYRFANLQPGAYSVTFTLQGFNT